MSRYMGRRWQQFVEDDGGRLAAGYKGRAGDCVTRSISIRDGAPVQGNLCPPRGRDWSSVGLRISFACGFRREQGSCLDLKGFGQALDYYHGGITNTALNPTHIGAMKVGAKGQLFLRDP